MSSAAGADGSAPQGGKGGNQEIAAKAADHALEALDTVIAHMRNPTRQSNSALNAARMVLEIAKELVPVSTPAAEPTVDDLAAARERLRKARGT